MAHQLTLKASQMHRKARCHHFQINSILAHVIGHLVPGIQIDTFSKTTGPILTKLYLNVFWMVAFQTSKIYDGLCRTQVAIATEMKNFKTLFTQKTNGPIQKCFGTYVYRVTLKEIVKVMAIN